MVVFRMPARDTTGLRIHRIDKDSVAEQSGQLHLTDCIIDVNGQKVDDLHFDRYVPTRSAKLLHEILSFLCIVCCSGTEYLTARVIKKEMSFLIGAFAIGH